MEEDNTRMKNHSIILFILFFGFGVNAQIAPDAGLIIPFTTTAKLSVSSGINMEFVRDGKTDSFWESNNALPLNYISSKEQNLFLNNANFECEGVQTRYMLAFDGNTDSKANIDKGQTKIKLYTRNPVKFISIKYYTIDTLLLKLHFANGDIIEKKYDPTGNYKLHSIEIENDLLLKEITIHNNSDYQLFELAAINTDIIEWVKFAFDRPTAVGYISSRHLNWDGINSIEILYSNNEVDWVKFKDLNPRAIAHIPILIEPEIYAQYLLIRFFLTPKPYNKATLREFAAYNSYGPFGKPENALPADNSWSESFGINTIWSWGYGIPSSMLKNDAGSSMFSSISSLARSYHRLDWDIEKPGDTPDFILRDQKSNSVRSKWLNWDEEYSIWKLNGFETDACILFNNDYFPEEKWAMPYKQAKKYGNEFGDYFGRKRKLIKLVEVGNEPWEYSKPLYKEILKGMSDGIKEIVPQMTVIPCGLQAYNKYFNHNNYLPDYLDNNVNVDGLNAHIYSYIFDDQGIRIAINPEDPRSETWSVNNLKKWASANNYPDAVYVTEFGFDSDGGDEDCTHSNCISELEQAIYGIRQAMIFYRLGVKQFYWYFYANVDGESIMHNRSGLVSSYKAGFKKKLSFKAFEIVNENLNDLYFSGIVIETDEVYCYSFADENGNPKAIVAWRPTSENHYETKWVDIPYSANIYNAITVIDKSQSVSYKREINKLKIALSGIPVIVLLR